MLFEYIKTTCFGICKFFILLGLITQFGHNILDLLGLNHYFHDQVEVELILTLSVFISIRDIIKPIEVKEQYKKYFQIFLTIGTLSNMIVAIVLTVAELFEILEEEIHFVHALIVFLLLNSIFSLLSMTIKYKNDYSFDWKKIFFYELIFIVIAVIMHFLIEPIFHLIDSIGYDYILYVLIPFVLFIWKKNIIMYYWESKKILILSMSTAVFMLLWQFGLLGFGN